MSRAFEWVDGSEGRARFSEGSGGADAAARDTFAVDLDGVVFFGEVRKRYDGEQMFLEVPSFGYSVEARVGIVQARTAFSPFAATRVERLVRELAATVAAYPERTDKPFVMRLSQGSSFSGDVRFDEGWIVVDPAAAP